MSDRKEISTHAPRTGSDCIFGQQRCCHKHISTHAPRTGSDGQCRRRVKGIDDFNPRSPHGERPRYCPSRPCLDRISTHAPRTGSDEMSSSYHASSSIFQPTLPARGATLIPTLHTPAVKISTHAPRTGSDLTRLTRAGGTGHFNPRSPHGERPAKSSRRAASRQFQPTLPARGATRRRRDEHRDGGISTHAPRTGSDFSTTIVPSSWVYFNPRSPHGERHAQVCGAQFQPADFNPRSPHGERPPRRVAGHRIVSISTHAPRTGSDPNQAGHSPAEWRFQPTLPTRGATPREICEPVPVPISTHAPRTGSDRDR